MRLEGLHHITAITGDAPRNVDFYTRLLGLRMVKKTVNFDAPDVYHLYYGDDRGTPGTILTFFEFPGAAPGRHGDGMPYRIEWRVGSSEALEFWKDRLTSEGIACAEAPGALRFDDHEGLEHALLAVEVDDEPLAASAQDVPAEHALQGFQGVRAYGGQPSASAELLGALGFAADIEGEWVVGGERRHARWTYDPPPAEAGREGAGSIHHVAWSAADDRELEAFRENATAHGARVTPVIDRQYFHSIYFREPSGVLFEVATRDIGFHVDESLESLGRSLKLPPQHEHLRERLERTLTPLP
jgi:glyoxalase family protein